MPLRIDITKYQGQSVPVRAPVIINQEGSIGRAIGNSVVLRDEAVSRMHATISFEDGSYYLTDRSSNGTLIHNRHLSVHGETVELMDGDVLHIGDHELSVRITARESAPHETRSSAAPLREGPVQAPCEEEKLGEYPHAGVRATEQAQGSALLFKELSIDDFFKDSEEEENSGKSVRAEPQRGPLSGGVPPALKKGGAGSYPKGLTTDEMREELDELFKDMDQSPSARPVDRPSESAPRGEPLHPPAAAPSHEHREAGSAPEASKVSEPIERAPEEFYRELFDRFLKGAGLQASSFTDAEIPELMESLGAVFRELVDGLWKVLRGRAEMKAEIRIASTMVRPASNNPLKFSPTLGDAVNRLVKRDHPSFLEPIDAVRESFEDIMNHQLALHAGIQASLVDVFARFDPERFSEKHKDSSVLHTRGKLWKAYCEAYPDLKEQALEGIFGKVFARAYLDQLEKLSMKKTGRTT